MRRFFLAALLLTLPFAHAGVPAAQTGNTPPVGDPAAGKIHWMLGNTSCLNCHGAEGQGAFGPALRNLDFERFRRYVREPFGRMPAFEESEFTDQEIADVMAYFASLPPATGPAEWRTTLPDGAPLGQQLAIGVIGCGQCHGPRMTTPRHGAAEVTGDFEWFKNMVYNHTEAQREQWAMLDPSLPPATPRPAGPNNRNRIRMGNYSPTRLPESNLREIWDWMNDIGVHLAPLEARIMAGAPGPNGVTYTVEVTNSGVKDKGVTMENVTVSLALPAGAKVVATTGAGYEGVRADAGAQGDVAVWRIPSLPAAEQRSLTLTLSPAPSNLRGVLRWDAPAVDPPDDMINFAMNAGGRGGA